MVNAIESALDAAEDGEDLLALTGRAYVDWGLAHPGAYQLLFESHDPLPETRAENGPRLQRRLVELVAGIDPDTPFATAPLLWSHWHGLVSLRLHKADWDWGLTTDVAIDRIIAGMRTAPCDVH